MTEVTYLGSVHGTQAALRRMLPRDRGKIVQVGSALGYRGIPLQATYCGAKHAVQGFMESLRTELLHRRSNVGLTLVQLPGLNTPQFTWVRARTEGTPRPVAPVYQPEVAARAIVWAAAHDRREVWVGLPTVYTIWGQRLAPWLAGWYLARTASPASRPASRWTRTGRLRRRAARRRARPRGARAVRRRGARSQPAAVADPPPAGRPGRCRCGRRRGRRRREGAAVVRGRRSVTRAPSAGAS